jgi:hypothetical protein
VSRIVDPNKFMLLGAVTDWLAVYRRYIDSARSPREIMAERKLEMDRIVQLRWLVAPELGYPTEPFQVWRRPAMPIESEKPVGYTDTFLFTMRLVVLDAPRVFVRVGLNAASTGSVMAFAGMPWASPLVAMRALSAGFNSVQLSGAAIMSLVLSPSATVQSITGLDHNAADDKSWELVEIVGLPVGLDWGGVLELDKPQGLIGSLGDGRGAALDRFRRGAPFYGWEASIPAGGAAPLWKLADPEAMLKVMEGQVLPPLRDMVTTLPPDQHAGYEVQHNLPPIDPVNPPTPDDDATVRVRPMCNLVFGAITDPLASLISGFGTAFEDTDIPPIVLGDRKLFGDSTRSDWDFMVTARYAKGADGQSEPIEYAAIVFAPGVGSAPPVPANLAAASEGLASPVTADADWRAIERVSWDKVSDALPFRVGSYAFARVPLSPAGPVVPLMGPRPYDDALQPISATTSPAGELTGRLGALDERYGVQSAPPSNVLLYGLAHQDLFGLWSPWASASASVAEPPVQNVCLLSARLETSAALAGPCPGTLVLEFSWDWATRTPQRIEIVGRMYAQAKLGEGPPVNAPPAGLQSSLAGGPGSVLQLSFNGLPAASVTAAAGLAPTLQYVSFDGKTLQNVPVVHAGPRRYRVTLTGLSLDFNAAGRIGLALWARGVENRAPNRVGAYNAQPLIASTADPRPPVLVVEHEDVLMASIADAAGEHHARLAWDAAPGAVGYFVYTTTEIKLRADRQLGDPLKSLTLAQRLVELRDAFEADPDRRSFTRVNAQPVSGTSMQVTLPRGTKEIHLYLVLGVSAGQVESAWPLPGSPGLRKKFAAYAAPQLVSPSPPDLEVTRTLDHSVDPPAYRAAVRVRTKPGAPVTRVDLHRVRVPEAAVELDTMGPPLARIEGSAGPYTVTATDSDVPGEAQAIGTIVGLDPVQGSWRRVFYRAVAWAGDDAPRGLFGARSKPSALREVIVPPAGAPDLPPLAWHWPGGGLGDVQVDGSTLSPIEATPLGDHRLRADVLAVHPDGRAEMLFRHPAAPGGDDRLSALGMAPPAPGSNGLWRAAGGLPGQTALHLLARRASFEDKLQVRLLLTDPLGRASEQVLEVPAGSPLMEPNILTPNVTKRLNVGFVVDFVTTVPLTTQVGPYRLLVNYAVDSKLPPLLLQQGLRAQAPAGARIGLRPQIHRLDIPLPDIPSPPVGTDIFTSTDLIPVQRGRAPGRGTLVVVGLRGSSGKVELKIVCPDGREAALQLTLS